MTPADIERVREWARLADQATPGPWESGPLGSGTVYSVVDYETRTTSGACDNDVRFIAAARMAVPELARMLGEALSERDQWRNVAGAWEDRAHAAMRLADVASDELKRLRVEPMTDEELDRIEALAANATPGPWDADHDLVEDDQGSDEVFASGIDSPTIRVVHGRFDNEDDAAFIAAARTDVSALVAEVRSLKNALRAREVKS